MSARKEPREPEEKLGVRTRGDGESPEEYTLDAAAMMVLASSGWDKTATAVFFRCCRRVVPFLPLSRPVLILSPRQRTDIPARGL